jgi:hypothetical protein
MRIKKILFTYCTSLGIIVVITLHLQHEGPHGGFSTKGVRSSLVEDAPTSTKHGRRGCVMGIV